MALRAISSLGNVQTNKRSFACSPSRKAFVDTGQHTQAARGAHLELSPVRGCGFGRALSRELRGQEGPAGQPLG